MKLLAMDGNSILNRAFYGIKLLSTKDGVYTNAVYGFINILCKLLESESPDGVAVAFDLHAPTFRHLRYDGYKAGRRPMPDELRSQFPLIKEWLVAAGYRVIEAETFEADDIIGTLADAAEKNGDECVISTGDRDSFQLIGDRVKVLLSSTKAGHPELICYTKEVLAEKYGLTPPQMIDLKAVMGDPSDKIPGVPGIGEKGATELIVRFGTLDNLYAHLDSPDIKDGVRNKLIAGKDSAYLSRFLGTICREVPIDRDLEHYRTVPRDDSALAVLMTRLELFRQMESMNLSLSVVQPNSSECKKEPYTLVSPEMFTSGEVTDFYADFSGNRLAVCTDRTVAVLPLSENGVLSACAATLLKSAEKKRIYDSKNLCKICLQSGFVLKNVVFDTILAAYLDNPNASDYDLARMAAVYGINEPDIVTEDTMAVLAAKTALINDRLSALLAEKGQSKLLAEIEIPLAAVLADMELAGVRVETEQVARMGNELGMRIEELQKSIFESVGCEFNLNSPKQLGEALFEKLGLPAKKKTSRGYSTSAEVLESLRYAHPAVELLLSYRQLTKLKSTYCDALAAAVGSDGRIHSTFNQTETRTGRISSLEPNLQNIPVRKPEGRKLRNFFTAKPGYVLCDADYSQIELRVLAAVAKDKNMIAAFQSGADIHTSTAAQVFGLPADLVTPELRSRAKAVNFGIVYGIGAFSLAKDIGVSRKEADEYIKNYLSVYDGVDRYMKESIETAKTQGFVTTLFGRRRYLPELSNSNHMIRAFGERVARNAPIQGTAADIIKIAMIRVSSRIEKEKLDARLILQVHDELIVECREDQKDSVCRLLQEEMENAADLGVRLVADVHSGRSWYEAKG